MALLAEYDFNENTGTTTADLTGNGYDLTTDGSGWVSGGYESSYSGKADFHGIVGSNVVQQSWTVMAWIRWNAMAVPYMAILSNGSNFYFELWRDGTSIECYSGVSGHPSSGPSIIPNGTWTHVAATRRSDGTSTVFVNGQPIVSGNGGAANFGAGTWYVGGANSPSYVLDGSVDALRIFDEALTTEQVNAWMQTPYGCKPPVLLSAYGFLENDCAVSVSDSSGNNRTGALTNSTTFEPGPQTGSRALRFTGTGQQIDLGRTGLEPDSMAGGVVVMGWVRWYGGNALSLLYKRLDSSGSTRCGIALYPNGKVFFVARWKDDLHYGEYGSSITDGNWHHVALVDGDTEWAFYIDGVQVDGGARAFNQSTSPTWENYPWIIGYSNGVSDTADSVRISGIRIFSGYMSQAQIQAQMNLAVAIQTMPTPMGAWSFDHVQGVTVYDDSGNSTNGTASDPSILTGTDLTFTTSGTSGGYGDKQSVDFPRARLEPFLEYAVMASVKYPGNFGTGDDTIFVKPRNTQSTAVGLYITSSDLFYVVSARGGGRDFANLPITYDTQWHHYTVTMTVDGTWVIYQDAVQIGSGTVTPTDTFLTWADYTWTLGTNVPADLGGNEAGMQVKDFRIFSQALTQSQVSYYMSNPVIPQGRKFRLGGVPKPIKLGSTEKFLGS